MWYDSLVSISLIIGSFIASFGACFFATLAGGGAGLILLPILLLLDIPFINALACHKLAVGFIGFGAAAKYFKAGIIDHKVFWWTAIVGVPFVILGTKVASLADPESMKLILGYVIIILVIIYGLRPSDANEHVPRPLAGKRLLIASICMAPIGYYSGWLSAGSGIFTTFIYIYFLGYDQLRASAMTIAANGIFWNGAGAIAHLTMGHIVWELAPGLIGGALLGSYLGAGVGIKKGNKFLKAMFLISALLTGVLMLLQ